VGTSKSTRTPRCVSRRDTGEGDEWRPGLLATLTTMHPLALRYARRLMPTSVLMGNKVQWRTLCIWDGSVGSNSLRILFQDRISGPVAPGVAGHARKLGHGHGQISQPHRSIGSCWRQRYVGERNFIAAGSVAKSRPAQIEPVYLG
jgi:hypothetical protein